MVKVKNLINDNNNAAANQFVIEDNDSIYFQSYESIIAKYEKGNRIVTITDKWDYSNTTRKHFYIFLRDYTPFNVYSKKDVLNYIRDGVFVIVDNDKFDF